MIIKTVALYDEDHDAHVHARPREKDRKAISTNRQVQCAKAIGGKPTDYSIGGAPGLRIRALPSGFKSWSLIYSAGNRKARIKLGEYPAMSLAQARAEALVKRADVLKGGDPARERKAAASANAFTFAKLAAEYIERHAKANKRSWRDDAIRLKATILPAIGHMAADKVAKSDILDLLNRKAGEGHAIAANRAQSLISSIYSWAVNEGIKPRAKEKGRERELSPEEMRAFWHGIEGSIAPASRDILRLALLTGQRESELCGAERGEFDWERKIWTIPGERTKNKKPHCVPLPPLALAIFKAAFERSRSRFAFTGSRPALAARPLNRSIVCHDWLAAREALGLGQQLDPISGKKKEAVRIHDLRRTLATQLGEMDFSEFEIGLVLNHSRGGVTARYDRAKREAKKLHMLSAWEARLMEIIEGREPETNVVAMMRTA